MKGSKHELYGRPTPCPHCSDGTIRADTDIDPGQHLAILRDVTERIELARR